MNPADKAKKKFQHKDSALEGVAYYTAPNGKLYRIRVVKNGEQLKNFNPATFEKVKECSKILSSNTLFRPDTKKAVLSLSNKKMTFTYPEATKTQGVQNKHDRDKIDELKDLLEGKTDTEEPPIPSHYRNSSEAKPIIPQNSSDNGGLPPGPRNGSLTPVTPNVDLKNNSPYEKIDISKLAPPNKKPYGQLTPLPQTDNNPKKPIDTLGRRSLLNQSSVQHPRTPTSDLTANGVHQAAANSLQAQPPPNTGTYGFIQGPSNQKPGDGAYGSINEPAPHNSDQPKNEESRSIVALPKYPNGLSKEPLIDQNNSSTSMGKLPTNMQDLIKSDPVTPNPPSAPDQQTPKELISQFIKDSVEIYKSLSSELQGWKEIPVQKTLYFFGSVTNQDTINTNNSEKNRLAQLTTLMCPYINKFTSMKNSLKAADSVDKTTINLFFELAETVINLLEEGNAKESLKEIKKKVEQLQPPPTEKPKEDAGAIQKDGPPVKPANAYQAYSPNGPPPDSCENGALPGESGLPEPTTPEKEDPGTDDLASLLDVLSNIGNQNTSTPQKEPKPTNADGSPVDDKTYHSPRKLLNSSPNSDDLTDLDDLIHTDFFNTPYESPNSYVSISKQPKKKNLEPEQTKADESPKDNETNHSPRESSNSSLKSDAFTDPESPESSRHSLYHSADSRNSSNFDLEISEVSSGPSSENPVYGVIPEVAKEVIELKKKIDDLISKLSGINPSRDLAGLKDEYEELNEKNSNNLEKLNNIYDELIKLKPPPPPPPKPAISENQKYYNDKLTGILKLTKEQLENAKSTLKKEIEDNNTLYNNFWALIKTDTVAKERKELEVALQTEIKRLERLITIVPNLKTPYRITPSGANDLESRIRSLRKLNSNTSINLNLFIEQLDNLNYKKNKKIPPPPPPPAGPPTGLTKLLNWHTELKKYAEEYTSTIAGDKVVLEFYVNNIPYFNSNATPEELVKFYKEYHKKISDFYTDKAGKLLPNDLLNKHIEILLELQKIYPNNQEIVLSLDSISASRKIFILKDLHEKLKKHPLFEKKSLAPDPNNEQLISIINVLSEANGDADNLKLLRELKTIIESNQPIFQVDSKPDCETLLQEVQKAINVVTEKIKNPPSKVNIPFPKNEHAQLIENAKKLPDYQEPESQVLKEILGAITASSFTKATEDLQRDVLKDLYRLPKQELVTDTITKLEVARKQHEVSEIFKRFDSEKDANTKNILAFVKSKPFIVRDYKNLMQLNNALTRNPDLVIGKQETYNELKSVLSEKLKGLQEQLKPKNGERTLENLATLSKKERQKAIQQLAKDFSQYNQYLCSKISSSEFHKLAWSKKNSKENSPNVLKVIEYHNNISNFVTSTIAFSKGENTNSLIHLFEELTIAAYELNDFSLTQSIRAGLNQSPVLRLYGKSDPEVSIKNRTLRRTTIYKPAKPTYNELTSFFETKNLLLYRERVNKLKTNDTPFVPFLGIFLTDLTFAYDGNSKFPTIAVEPIVKEVEKQLPVPSLEAPTMTFDLENMLANLPSETIMYNQSLKRRPRNGKRYKPQKNASSSNNQASVKPEATPDKPKKNQTSHVPAQKPLTVPLEVVENKENGSPPQSNPYGEMPDNPSQNPSSPARPLQPRPSDNNANYQQVPTPPTSSPEVVKRKENEQAAAIQNASQVLTDEEKRMAKQNSIIKEFRETEKKFHQQSEQNLTYLDIMNGILTKSKGKSVQKAKEQIKVLKKEITSINEKRTTLLEEIDKADTPEKLSALILSESFKSYLDSFIPLYFRAHTFVSNVFQHYSKRELDNKKDTKQLKNEGTPFSTVFQNIHVIYVQRIPRYQMLIKDLLETVKEEKKPLVQKALSALKEKNEAFNEDTGGVTQRLLNTLSNTDESLIQKQINSLKDLRPKQDGLINALKEKKRALIKFSKKIDGKFPAGAYHKDCKEIALLHLNDKSYREACNDVRFQMLMIYTSENKDPELLKVLEEMAENDELFLIKEVFIKDQELTKLTSNLRDCRPQDWPPPQVETPIEPSPANSSQKKEVEVSLQNPQVFTTQNPTEEFLHNERKFFEKIQKLPNQIQEILTQLNGIKNTDEVKAAIQFATSLKRALEESCRIYPSSLKNNPDLKSVIDAMQSDEYKNFINKIPNIIHLQNLLESRLIKINNTQKKELNKYYEKTSKKKIRPGKFFTIAIPNDCDPIIYMQHLPRIPLTFEKIVSKETDETLKEDIQTLTQSLEETLMKMNEMQKKTEIPFILMTQPEKFIQNIPLLTRELTTLKKSSEKPDRETQKAIQNLEFAIKKHKKQCSILAAELNKEFSGKETIDEDKLIEIYLQNKDYCETYKEYEKRLKEYHRLTSQESAVDNGPKSLFEQLPDICTQKKKIISLF